MGDVINLRQARKARKRAESRQQADANRLKHGRTKAQKQMEEAAGQKRDAVLDGARREGTEG